jgi:hypothetical protein
MRLRIAAAFLVGFTACHVDGGPRQAEVLSTPFPGTVLTARAMGQACSSDGCLFDYTVRIANPTDRDADVQSCTLVERPHMSLPVMGVAGFRVPAGAVRTVTARWVLPMAKDEVADLVGQDIACIGLDWHGDPPI